MTDNLEDLMAGERAANVDASMAIPADKAKKGKSKVIGIPVSANTSNANNNPIPKPIPMIAPNTPSNKPSNKKILLASLSLIPIAFKIPSCFDFCKTVMAKTEEIPSTTEIITNI